MGDVNRQHLALSCAMYDEKKNGAPRCSALVYMFCLEEGKCKFRKPFYAADDVIKMPCYDPKHDCSKRSADCHAFCLDYRRAAAELAMRNAAKKSVTAAYIADGIRKTKRRQT